jgi:hypothetical protein
MRLSNLTEKYAAGAMVHRNNPRFAVPWKIAVVYKRMGSHESYYGNVCDVSLGGASFMADMNIYSVDPAAATIEILASPLALKNNIVGARCQILHSVLSSQSGKFRVGAKFLDFNGQSRGYLEQALSVLTAIRESNQVYR